MMPRAFVVSLLDGGADDAGRRYRNDHHHRCGFPGFVWWVAFMASGIVVPRKNEADLDAARWIARLPRPSGEGIAFAHVAG